MGSLFLQPYVGDDCGAVTIIATIASLELCDLQADSFMQGKRHLDSEEFWRLVSEEKYPKLCTSLLFNDGQHVLMLKRIFHNEAHKVEDTKST